MIVKICGITNSEDARVACEAGASALGFNFFLKSPRYLTPSKAAMIANRVAVLKVGVFVNEPASEVERIANVVGLDVVQLHGDCERPEGWRVWRAVSAGEPLPGEDVEAFLVDSLSGEQYGGTGRTFDWSLLRGTTARIVLAGGLGPDNVAAAIAAARPWGVDACSRLELSPGKKDHAKMTAFVRTALENS